MSKLTYHPLEGRVYTLKHHSLLSKNLDFALVQRKGNQRSTNTKWEEISDTNGKAYFIQVTEIDYTRISYDLLTGAFKWKIRQNDMPITTFLHHFLENYVETPCFEIIFKKKRLF